MLGIARTYQAGGWGLPGSHGPSQGFYGPIITANATVHTKGAYAELVAATTYDWYGFWISMSGVAVSATRTDMLLDVAIGGAGSEQVILPNLMAGWTMGGSGNILYIPIYIPRGTRLSARCQAVVSGDQTGVMLWGMAGHSGLPGPLFSQADDYGTVLASSKGAAHTPGNGVLSTATNVGGTTSRIYGAVLLMVAPDTTTVTARGVTWNLVFGGQAYAEWFDLETAAEQLVGPLPPAPNFCSVPAGTQLQVQGTSGGAGNAHTVILYGFY
ncbi:MAG: hypothetical protein H8K07_01685 [Nitrospira sp.]|nr:hypothetical protein [Nitrospira sp.]